MLAYLNGPPEVIFSYVLAEAFGIVALWGIWFAVFIMCASVLREFAARLAPGHQRRASIDVLLAYAERYGQDGRFPWLIRFAFAAAVLNAVFTTMSVVGGYAMERFFPGIPPVAVLVYSAAWIFGVYVSLFTIGTRRARRFSREAEARGYPLHARIPR